VSEEGQKRTWTPEQREKIMQARRERAQKNGSRTDAELIAEDVVGDAVANVITLSGFLMPIAPYTAVTIAGVPDPENEGSMLVQSRAEMAGRVLLEHAKRNHRVLAAIARFNQLFQSVELVEVVGSVVAAGAVDAHVVEPDATIALPDGAQVPILAPVIGDTIAYIAAQEDQARAQGIEVPRRGRRTTPEPDEGPRDRRGMTERQRAEAAESRARLAARDAALARGEPDPTLRREGQTVVAGDVTAT
jgi:hypothetical protein